MSQSLPRLGDYLGPSLIVCGISWVWGYITSSYFPEQASLSLNLVSFIVYLEAGTIGSLLLARKISNGLPWIGVRVGFWAWTINTLFRLVIFDFATALDGVFLFLLSFVVGGFLADLLKRLRR
jgi:hypothetical protein